MERRRVSPWLCSLVLRVGYISRLIKAFPPSTNVFFFFAFVHEKKLVERVDWMNILFHWVKNFFKVGRLSCAY